MCFFGGISNVVYRCFKGVFRIFKVLSKCFSCFLLAVKITRLDHWDTCNGTLDFVRLG